MALDDEKLLDLVQQQTLKYFTDFAHPDSGMARERTNNIEQYGRDAVTTGGTGFGIMGIVAGASRGWLTREDARARIEKITDFLTDKAESFDGVFPHFLDGTTGETLDLMGPKDNGSDVVETSFLFMGLLTARQYFDGDAPEETRLRDKINKLWEGCDWTRHVKPGEDALRWHRGPGGEWDLNLPLKGWNEGLVTYLLAASSPTHAVSEAHYKKGWEGGTEYKNGKSYHGIELPLGPEKGGPLFLSQYSFLGIDPRGLTDGKTDFLQQNVNQTLINRAHCIDNPHGHKGYGENCWGLTASDDPKGYDAHSPTNDNGTISPTAALSAFPYTPKESMAALRHFFEDRGDKIWGEYGFADAFNDGEDWQARTCLSIDQGPIIAMIENHRSGLLWDLFMSCPEVKLGLEKLGIDSPHLAPGKAPAPAKPAPFKKPGLP
ncbi:MAG: beta-glucosidase [Alphaproteobacteria bacterium]|nr:beta-glucosidase [Alphaproteobacteria bacterium]